MYPTPSAVAIASASRGFLRGVSGAAVASVVGVIRVIQILVQRKDDGVPLASTSVFFSEDRFGHHVLLAGPVPQVPFPAAFAAKRKVCMNRGGGLRFANGGLVFHRAIDRKSTRL